MHHMDPAAPGHHSTSDGLLPAFNANTKPLKSHALDQLLRILMRAVGHRTMVNIASVSAQHGNPASWPMGHSRVASPR
jgi:hypothetical protein